MLPKNAYDKCWHDGRSILIPIEVRVSNIGPQTCPSSIIDLMLNWSICFFPFIEVYHF